MLLAIERGRVRAIRDCRSTVTDLLQCGESYLAHPLEIRRGKGGPHRDVREQRHGAVELRRGRM